MCVEEFIERRAGRDGGGAVHVYLLLAHRAAAVLVKALEERERGVLVLSTRDTLEQPTQSEAEAAPSGGMAVEQGISGAACRQFEPVEGTRARASTGAWT